MASTSTSATFTGLGTFTLYVPTPGPIEIKGKIAFSTIPQGISVNSQVLVTITQNSTTIYTGLAGAEGFRVATLGAQNDAINIALTSSLPQDQVLNTITTTVTIG